MRTLAEARLGIVGQPVASAHFDGPPGFKSRRRRCSKEQQVPRLPQ